MTTRRGFYDAGEAARSQPVIGWTIDRYSCEPVFVAVASIRRVEPVVPGGGSAA
jgi:hypothetical protein